MLYQGGEKIQEIVNEKSRVQDVPEATIVDGAYAFVLFVLKLESKIPMSTTWCFMGLLSGREICIALMKAGKRTLKQAIKISLKDLGYVTIGFIISLLIGMGANQYVLQGFKEFFA